MAAIRSRRKPLPNYTEPSFLGAQCRCESASLPINGAASGMNSRLKLATIPVSRPRDRSGPPATIAPRQHGSVVSGRLARRGDKPRSWPVGVNGATPQPRSDPRGPHSRGQVGERIDGRASGRGSIRSWEGELSGCVTAYKSNLRVVLVETRNPLNMGAAARAIANFGFSHLRVVNPYDVAFREARSAVGAAPLLRAAEEFSTVAAAVADCRLVVDRKSDVEGNGGE